MSTASIYTIHVWIEHSLDTLYYVWKELLKLYDINDCASFSQITHTFYSIHCCIHVHNYIEFIDFVQLLASHCAIRSTHIWKFSVKLTKVITEHWLHILRSTIYTSLKCKLAIIKINSRTQYIQIIKIKMSVRFECVERACVRVLSLW